MIPTRGHWGKDQSLQFKKTGTEQKHIFWQKLSSMMIPTMARHSFQSELIVIRKNIFCEPKDPKV